MAARGATLVELLVALVIAGVLLALALPGFRSLIAQERATAGLNQMIGAISFSRTAAIGNGRTVTLCPSDGERCLGRNQWHRGALAFIDDNGNGTPDGADRVLTRLPALPAGARLYWRSFRNRSYLQFQPRGYTAWQNGNLLYCPEDGDAEHTAMLILNVTGRTRVARDRDGDGRVEDAQGQAVACP